MTERRPHRRTGNPRGNPNWRKKKNADPTPESETVPEPEPTEESEDEGLVFEVEDAPEDEPEPELSGMARIRAAAAGVLGRVGIVSSAESAGRGGKPADSSGGRLTRKQKEFAETITPACVAVFIFAAQWLWKRRGIEYVVLAPDDETATKIIAPLVRILARHSKNGGMSPDTLDMLASFGAIMAYGRYVNRHYEAVASGMYNQEEQEQEVLYEPATAYDTENGTVYNLATGTTGAANARGYEGGNVGSHYRRAYRYQSNSADIHAAGNDGVSDTFSVDNLDERSRKQFEALRALAHRDLQSRARRSGKVRILYKRAG
jgi:hypothetical protein